MSQTQCPKCGDSVPEGAESCPGCGHLFEGEQFMARQVSSAKPHLRKLDHACMALLMVIAGVLLVYGHFMADTNTLAPGICMAAGGIVWFVGSLAGVFLGHGD